MYSVKEIAKIWNLSDRRVREMCAKGLIPNVAKVGKSYLIPKKAKRPEKKEKYTEVIDNKICIVSNDNNFVASSIVYNFFVNEEKVDVNFNVSKIDKQLKPNKVDYKRILNKIKNGNYEIVVLVDFIDKKLIDGLDNTKVIYIGEKYKKNYNINQIVEYSLPDYSDYTNMGLSFFCGEGLLKQIYDIICDVKNEKYQIPMTFNFNNTEYTPSLIYDLVSVQKSYDFLGKQYDLADNDSEYFSVSMSNNVEFTDSSQELDYANKIVKALKRNIAVKFIYIYEKENLKKIAFHYTTKIYLDNFNEKCAAYMINIEDLDHDMLDMLGQGLFLYKDNGVYHDNISEYTLGYVNANREHLEEYQKMLSKVISLSSKITSNAEMEEYYELHK